MAQRDDDKRGKNNVGEVLEESVGAAVDQRISQNTCAVEFKSSRERERERERERVQRWAKKWS